MGFVYTLLLLTDMLVLVGCQAGDIRPASGLPVPNPPPASKPAVIQAVTTLNVLADMIRNVGGDRVRVTNIIPAGSGPENYQPKPEDAKVIARSDIVFYNGHGLEDWLTDLFTSAGRPDLPKIELSAGLQSLDAGSADFREGNPHFWLSVVYGQHYVEVIRQALIQVDPAGRELYSANADRYLAQLGEVNDRLRSQAGTVPPQFRKLVTNHDAFPYFAQEYGFTVVGSILGSPEAQPAAGELATLVQKVKAENVRAVFSESQFNPKLTQILADEAGVRVVTNLYTDTLSEPGGPADTYVKLLEFDMSTIVTALKGEPLP